MPQLKVWRRVFDSLFSSVNFRVLTILVWLELLVSKALQLLLHASYVQLTVNKIETFCGIDSFHATCLFLIFIFRMFMGVWNPKKVFVLVNHQLVIQGIFLLLDFDFLAATHLLGKDVSLLAVRVKLHHGQLLELLWPEGVAVLHLYSNSFKLRQSLAVGFMIG